MEMGLLGGRVRLVFLGDVIIVDIETIALVTFCVFSTYRPITICAKMKNLEIASTIFLGHLIGL